MNDFLRILAENNVYFDYILDIGAGIGHESNILSNQFPDKKIFSFECNPECIRNFQRNEKITLIEKAVWEADGYIDFYPVVNGNPHASSVFLATDEYNKNEHKHGYLHQPNKIEVESTRLDTFIEQNNLQNQKGIIWIDLQGAELNALKGMSKYIENIQVIWTEVEYKPVYKDQDLFENVIEFMNDKKLNLIFPDKETIANNINSGLWWDDFCFIR